MGDFDKDIVPFWPKFFKTVTDYIYSAKSDFVWGAQNIIVQGLLRRFWGQVLGNTDFVYDEWKHVVKDVVRQ